MILKINIRIIENDSHFHSHTRKGVKQMNKFLYLKVVQGNYGYGHGWEDLCMSASLKEAYHDLNEYIRSGHSGGFRIINRRVPNPEYARGGDKNA